MNLSSQNYYSQLINLSSTKNLSYSDEYIQLIEQRIEAIAYYDIEGIKDKLINKRNDKQKRKKKKLNIMIVL